MKKYRRLTLAAVFAAVITLSTLFLRVPTAVGYIHLGDGAVLLGALMLDAPFSCAAAVIGSALADLLGGYAVYIPATAVIKCGMVLIMRAFLAKKDGHTAFRRVFGCALAEGFMVIGYFIYEAFVLSYGAGALPGVALDAVQGVCGGVMALVVFKAMKNGNSAK